MFDCEENKIVIERKERLIKIQLEDVTILDKRRLEREDSDKDEKTSPTVDERVIPITMESGEVMKPVFTSLEDLKPPIWSVFHKDGTKKDKEIKIEKENQLESSKINKVDKRLSVTGLDTLVGR